MTRWADADGAMLRTIWRRVRSDREFLANVRALRDANDFASLVVLEDAVRRQIEAAEERERQGPRWRAVVVERALRHVMRGLGMAVRD